MCTHSLCVRGNNGLCYFRRDPNRIGRYRRDITEERWDELDALHDAFIARPTSQSAAYPLGLAILTTGEEATDLDAQLGARRFREMEERYAEPKQRTARKVIVLKSDDGPAAAAKLRQLGDEFVSALLDVLKEE